jgi:hypothetical protein
VPESLEKVANIIALVLDAKLCGHRTRSLQQVNSAALKSLAELAAKRSDFDQHAAAKNAALDKRERKLNEREVALNAKAAQLDERHHDLSEFYKNTIDKESALKRRLLSSAGVTPWKDGFQNAPSWDEVDRLLDLARDDPHEPTAELVNEPVPELQIGANLTRSISASRTTAARRAERRAAEGLA